MFREARADGRRGPATCARRRSCSTATGRRPGVGDGDVREYAACSARRSRLAEASGDPALLRLDRPGLLRAVLHRRVPRGGRDCDRAIELAGGDATLGGGVNYALPVRLVPRVQGHGPRRAGRARRGPAADRAGPADRRRAGGPRGRRLEPSVRDLPGLPRRASRRPRCCHARQGVEIAERIGDAFSRVFGWFSVGLAEQMHGEWQRAIDAIERSVAVARASRTAIEPDAAAERVLPGARRRRRARGRSSPAAWRRPGRRATSSTRR